VEAKVVAQAAVKSGGEARKSLDGKEKGDNAAVAEAGK
jgi:hypothetical protein